MERGSKYRNKCIQQIKDEKEVVKKERCTVCKKKIRTTYEAHVKGAHHGSNKS